jgi:uncharacterized membrane protein YedE/YeeE
MMFPDSFTPTASLAGGVLIGLAAAMMLLLQGRIAGVSGILAGVLCMEKSELPWRLAFLAGMFTAGFFAYSVAPGAFEFSLNVSGTSVAVAGLLVGFGTRLGSGCTSGHGVCGIGRASPRSLVATLVFMATGMLTVYVVNMIYGGAL